MNRRARTALCIAAFAGVTAPAAKSYACASDETAAHTSQYATWCVETAQVNAHDFSKFYPYGDQVIQELIALFDVTPNGNGMSLPLTIEVRESPGANGFSGGAQTPSDCCGFGEAVIADAYYNNAEGVDGFYGYLLTLHELINQWTGIVSGGWPTDFWADHVSAFPNSMDWQIMAALGTKLNDANLTKASAAQKARFYPGGDGPPDPRVPMFDKIFALPNMGFTGWSRIFSYINKDKMSWDGLGVANPAQLRTEYVAAYVSLGPGQSVLPIMQAANVANGTDDGAGAGDPTYTASQSNIDAIATAHCSIAAAEAAGTNESADRSALTSGKFAQVTAKGKCGAGCPAECGCKTSTGLCVAPWLADALSDGGAGMPGSGVGSDGGTGGGSGGGSGGGTGGGSGGGTGGGSGGGTGGGSGGGTGGGSGGGVVIGHDSGAPVSGGGADGGSNGATGGGSSNGCGCRTIGETSDTPVSGLFALGTVGMFAFARGRRRRR